MITRPVFTNAVCRGAQDLWFPTRRSVFNAAKRACQTCPHRWECLAFELDRMEIEHDIEHTYGVWGGTTARERQRLIADRRLVPGLLVPLHREVVRALRAQAVEESRRLRGEAMAVAA